jgi:hypothetical protein
LYSRVVCRSHDAICHSWVGKGSSQGCARAIAWLLGRRSKRGWPRLRPIYTTLLNRGRALR